MKSETTPNAFPIGLDDIPLSFAIFSTSSGLASVAKSKSLGDLPKIASLIAPPTT